MNAGRREVLAATDGRSCGYRSLAEWYAAAAAIGWLPARIAAPFVGTAAGKVAKVDVGQRSVTYAVGRGTVSPRRLAALGARSDSFRFGLEEPTRR